MKKFLTPLISILASCLFLFSCTGPFTQKVKTSTTSSIFINLSQCAYTGRNADDGTIPSELDYFNIAILSGDRKTTIKNSGQFKDTVYEAELNAGTYCVVVEAYDSDGTNWTSFNAPLLAGVKENVTVKAGETTSVSLNMVYLTINNADKITGDWNLGIIPKGADKTSGSETQYFGGWKTGTENGEYISIFPDTTNMTNELKLYAQYSSGYQFGENVLFHSDNPVTYTMFFSDASWYPMTETWMTEGLFKKIEELTNVHLEITPFDSTTYNDDIANAIDGGNSAYIIPKVYDESWYIGGGAIVPVSDYIQYMPNFTSFYNTYNMKTDVDTIVKSDGKFYRLPGMLEKAMQDYTIFVRKDYFEGAGINVAEEEINWTWDDLREDLKKVKAYMVSQGIIGENDYVWSDLWCGSESGRGTGGNLLKLMGNSYGIDAGWIIGNGVQYDQTSNQFYFAGASDAMKQFLECANRYIAEGILDPATFTQDDTTALNRFYSGKTAIISVNRGQYTTWEQGLKDALGEGNYETYYAMTPVALNRYTAENQRLENGVMISKRARQELGEEGFIKMMRFVDWLWYSPEAYSLFKWGPEGETWQYVTDAATGLQVKQLLPGFKCSGLSIPGDDSDIDIRLEWGYAGGNFWYGHTLNEIADNFSPVHQSFYDRLGKYRDSKPLSPAVAFDEDDTEQANLWGTPLKDCIATWSLQFILGQKDLSKDWDAYVKECQTKNCDSLVSLYKSYL